MRRKRLGSSSVSSISSSSGDSSDSDGGHADSAEYPQNLLYKTEVDIIFDFFIKRLEKFIKDTPKPKR